MDEQTTVLDIAALLKSDGCQKDVVLTVPLQETDPNFHDVTVTFRFKNLSGALTCKATVGGVYESTCDRCLKPVSLTLSASIDTVVTADDSRDDSVSVCGGKIDVVKTCYDALSLELPLVVLCKEDCKGLCPVCGADRNEHDCGCN